MKIAFGCDHAAIDMKVLLMDHLKAAGHEVVDYGCYDSEDKTNDYPDVAVVVAEAVAAGEAEKGVLICGTGIGVSLAANKVPGIRAAVCNDPFCATKASQHNNANIITLGARVVGSEMAMMIADAFFNTPFEGGRHQRRIDKITAIEQKYSK